MRAVVTGGAGFIGSNLVDALIARGDEVTACDSLVAGRRENLAGALAAGGRLETIDVCDGAGLGRVFDELKPEVVFHLAAQVDVRRSVEDPAADARTNIEGTINALQAARTSGARRLVLASTGGAIYGDADTIPTPESAPERPLAPYGQAKLAAEGYCRMWSELCGLTTAALRLANVYGPRQDPAGEGGVVAIFCGRLRAGMPLLIYGDGSQTRDFVYVGDVVDAMLRAGDANGQRDQRNPAPPLNIGAGRETSVLQLAAACREVAGAPELPPPLHVRARPGEVHRSCLDAGAAHAGLGWTASTPLWDGLAATYAALA